MFVALCHWSAVLCLLQPAHAASDGSGTREYHSLSYVHRAISTVVSRVATLYRLRAVWSIAF